MKISKHILTLGVLFTFSMGFLQTTATAEGLRGTKSGESRRRKGKSEVVLVLKPRKATWKLDEPMFFDVDVKNDSQKDVQVPYVYDGSFEIDGHLYTQFPKPKVSGDTLNSIPAKIRASHGTITLNHKGIQIMDVETGRKPYVVSVGSHELVLICGPYKSEPITFVVLP